MADAKCTRQSSLLYLKIVCKKNNIKKEIIHECERIEKKRQRIRRLSLKKEISADINV